MGNERGFGVAGALDHAIVREIARAVEVAGYRAFWVNDTPQGDGLAALAEAARVTSRLRLAVGVIPLDRQPPDHISTRVKDLGLPIERLTLGVGAGRAALGLDLVREAVPRLQADTGATVTIGALGPKMCALAGEVADGVLLNWMTPQYAAQSAELVRRAAHAASRPAPRIDGYVRVALTPAARDRMYDEADRYAGISAYAAHFSRMGVNARATTVYGETADTLQASLRAYDPALDEVVVRAITAEETAPAYLELVEAAAPR